MPVLSAKVGAGAALTGKYVWLVKHITNCDF